jgi:hypothetical protein
VRRVPWAMKTLRTLAACTKSFSALRRNVTRTDNPVSNKICFAGMSILAPAVRFTDGSKQMNTRGIVAFATSA